MTTLLIILCIILIPVIMGLITKKEMAIDKDITIHRPAAEIFDFLKFIKNHDQFSEWAKAVPENKKRYRGTDGQVGFVYAWDSAEKNVGSGEQEIMKLEASRIEHQLRFVLPRPGVATSTFTLSPAQDNATNVRWSFYSEMKFPGTIMKPLIRGFLARNTEKGLQSLKAVMEK